MGVCPSALAIVLKLYNTLSRSRQPFEPLVPGQVTMYVCGVTVYSFAHIGNARPYVVFDVLARLLRRSYDLKFVRNITDVDDKINAAARDEGVSIGELTTRFTAHPHEDMAALGVLPPDVEPRVTGHMAEIISMIERLLTAGSAYEAEGHVLFSVASFDAYGQLSRRSTDDMIAGARVEVAPYKRDPGDFVLWKPAAANDPGWDSPWGRGRPGWHIECSAMAETHLGDTIDIHGGGLDLVFPHHENELAQSTCVHGGATFARFWLHNGMVNVEAEKMSKSIGNVMIINELRAAHRGEVLRLGLLSAHYRQPLDWSARLLAEAKKRLDRMYAALRDAGLSGLPDTDVDPPAAVVAALEDDLNTPEALAAMAELVRATNRASQADERLALARQLQAGGALLGLLQDSPTDWFAGTADGADSDAEIDALIARRDAARQAKDFATADQIRDALAERGIVLEDGSSGSRWRRE